MAIELKEIEHLATLARIAVSDEEKKILQHDLEEILAYVSQIKEAEQKEHFKKGEQMDIFNIMRDDSEPYKPGIFTEDLLAAVPKHEENRVFVKKIL